MTIEPAWIALAGTVFGGVGLKVAEHWLGRNKMKVDDAQQIRDELRLEISSQREEIRQLEVAVDKWREQYYALLEKYMSQATELTFAVKQLRVEAEEIQAMLDPLNTPPPPPVEPLDTEDKS